MRFARSPRPASCTCPAATPRRSARSSRTPTSPRTYAAIGRKGIKAFYRGNLAGEIVDGRAAPAHEAGHRRSRCPSGYLTARRPQRYQALGQAPTQGRATAATTSTAWRRRRSGGSTVGEALNILEHYDLDRHVDAEALHRYLEASALAFADRGKYVGDPRVRRRPARRPAQRHVRRGAGLRDRPDEGARSSRSRPATPRRTTACARAGAGAGTVDDDTENISTTNLTVADKWGNVVEYTLTIEQTGGSGIVVPGRGFLLNNELTDFSTVYDAADPNRIQPGKRPRSSMSPTIILKDGKPFLALGSPGGSTIITTVLQMLFNRIDLGMTHARGHRAPRASQRNTASVTAEPEFITVYGASLTAATATSSCPPVTPFTSAAEIGAATAIEFGKKGKVTAVAEPDVAAAVPRAWSPRSADPPAR